MSPILIANYIVVYMAVAILVAATASSTFDRQYLAKGIVGVLWPLIAAVVLIALPFLAIGWLGERVGNWARNLRK